MLLKTYELAKYLMSDKKKTTFKIDTFIQRGCIQLLKSDSKDIYNIS